MHWQLFKCFNVLEIKRLVVKSIHSKILIFSWSHKRSCCPAFDRAWILSLFGQPNNKSLHYAYCWPSVLNLFISWLSTCNRQPVYECILFFFRFLSLSTTHPAIASQHNSHIANKKLPFCGDPCSAHWWRDPLVTVAAFCLVTAHFLLNDRHSFLN